MSLCLTSSVLAYVGPGAGLGLLGALLAVGGAVLAALLFVVLWPIRMMLRKVKANANPSGVGEQRTAV